MVGSGNAVLSTRRPAFVSRWLCDFLHQLFKAKPWCYFKLFCCLDSQLKYMRLNDVMRLL